MIVLIPHELTKIANIRRYKQRYESILDYYYRHYMYFQGERSKRFAEIKTSLLQNTDKYQFKNWHRIIDLRYVDQALSSKGSVLSDPGGRFNIGSIDDLKFSKFPSLYLAEDYETAYREKNQTAPSVSMDCGLSSDELSLTNTSSTVDLLVEGSLDSVLDLRNEDCLYDFYQIIKDIALPKRLEQEAKKLNIGKRPTITSCNNYFTGFQ